MYAICNLLQSENDTSICLALKINGIIAILVIEEFNSLVKF